MVKLYFLALFLFYSRARSYSENQNEKVENNINYPEQVYSPDDNYIHEEESYTHDSRRADSDRIANYGEDSYTDTDSPEDDIKRYYYIPSFQGPIILDGLGDISSKIPAYLSSGAKHGKYSAIKDYADYGGHDYLRRNKIKIKLKEGKKKTKIIGSDIGDLGIQEIRKLLEKRGPRKQNKNRNRERPFDSDDSSVSHNKHNKKRPRVKSTKPTKTPDYDQYYKYDYPSDETTMPPKHKDITKLPPKDVDNANKKINEPDVDNEEQYDDDDDGSNSFNDRDKEGRDQDIDDGADNSDFGAPRLPDDYYDDVLNKYKPGTPTGTIGYIGKIENHGHSGILTNRWVNGNLVKTLSQKTDSVIETVSSKIRQHMTRVCVMHPHAEYCLGQEARRLLRLG